MKLFIVFAFASVASLAFGQGGKTMFFDGPEACLAAAEGTFVVYQPHFKTKLGWWQEMVSLGKAHEVTAEGVTCAEEFTVEGWHIVRWPADSRYFETPDGKLADGRCGNDVRRIWHIPPPVAEVPPPPPVPEPPTLNLPPPPEFVVVPMPPPGLVFRRTEIEVEIVEERGHKFPIPCVPREKGWYGIGIPVAECAALVFGGLEAAGVFKAAVIIKAAVPVVRH